MLSIVVLNPSEEFLQFLDPELCDLKESQSVEGLKTLEVEYTFQDAKEDKELFKIGNKIWIQGDVNLSDCLYVIDTEVKQSVFKDNSFTFEAEEVLVELNYTPLVSHTELDKTCFKTRTTNGELTVRIDWNSLNRWFGDYFNIGVVQDCLSTYASYVPFTGTMTRMSLLRLIEEHTGNVFVTRYEKDYLDNTIHRYLDFLNPINVSKNWTLNLEYTFMGEMKSYSFDDDGNPVPEDKPWDVTRFIDDKEDPDWEWIAEDNEYEDEDTIKHYKSYHDIIAENIEFRILDNELKQYNVEGADLKWSAEDVDFGADTGNWVITLVQKGKLIGLSVNETSFVVPAKGTTDYVDKYVEAIKNDELDIVAIDDVEVILGDDSYFEIYDTVYDQTLFRTQINNQVGHVHSEVLDFGFNLENVEYNVDESSTYTAVSPILQLNNDNGVSSSLTRANLTDLINKYNNLEISKGQTIPMIIQKVNIKKPTLEEAKMSLGSYIEHSGDNQSNSTSNWWCRPYHPQDQKNDQNSSENTWEFYRGTAYWKAPYPKLKGILFVETDKGYSTQYSKVIGRNDTRDDKGAIHSPKMGTTESSDEDIFAIYNQVALYLKQHETPKVEVDVDVANLRGHEYNNYNVHDKIYIKLPDNNELITARVTETHKEAHDIAKNTIKVSNYTPINNAKTELQETIINGDNVTFKYPSSKTLTVQLENLDYQVDTSTRTRYPANKLLSFTLYSVKDGSRTFKKNYTKITNYEGKASLKMKYDPGDYIIEVSYGGDEEYLETTHEIKVNVSGKKEVKQKKQTSSKNKTTKKTTKKVTKTTYYDKYGRSPDKKKVLGIGRISAGGDKGSYKEFFGTEVKNKCPYCGKASLVYQIYWGGEHGDYHKLPVMGNNSKGSNMEGAFFCTNLKTCGADFSAQGNEHISGGKKLTITKKRFKSSKADAKKLMKGKYVYNKTTTTNSKKNVGNNQKRKIIGHPSAKVKKQALAIVGDKIGRKALLEICKWMDKHIHYGPGDGYGGFQRSPDTVLRTHLCNCCDGTRLFFELCDAAGLCEYYDMYYVNLSCPRYGHVYGRIRTKKTGHWVNIDTASDSYGCYGYVCDSCSRTSPVDSKYPTKPF